MASFYLLTKTLIHCTGLASLSLLVTTMLAAFSRLDIFCSHLVLLRLDIVTLLPSYINISGYMIFFISLNCLR